MLYALLLAASVIAGPDAQTIFDQAALAWEARSQPDTVAWNLTLSPRSAARTDSYNCTAEPGGGKRTACTGPDGAPLFFDETNDPFKEPPGAYTVELAGMEQSAAGAVYHLTVTPRAGTPGSASPLRALWVGADDFEVYKLTYASVTYAFERYGETRTWWTQRVDAPWGTAQTQSVDFSGPRTIAKLRVSPLCSAVRSMVVPFLSIERSNRALFANMDANVQKYQDAAQAASDAGSPGLILARANLDWYAAQMYDNLARADLLLKASYARTPQGGDPPLDAIRNRIQTLVDVERIATNDYASLAAPRATSYRYWNGVAAEVERISQIDGGNAAHDPPPRQDYATGWLLEQLLVERREIARPAMMAADYCGLQTP